MQTTNSNTRTTEQGRTIHASTVQGFILAALSHEAATGRVDQLLYDHVVDERCHSSVVTASLRPIIDEVLAAATREDWDAITRHLVSEVHYALGDAASKRAG
jgi:hypothetical protein